MLLRTRRSLLASASLVATAPRAAWAQQLATGAFTHGVASGDPLPNGVILWTRFAPTNGSRIAWEISEDESFTRIALRGEAEASPVNDYCVKVDVRGLLPGRAYYYRFLSASGPSLTGLTRAAPQSARSLTVGLVSSTLHLSHPERAWRAFSQWRSSWLSREGVAAVGAGSKRGGFACDHRRPDAQPGDSWLRG